MDRVVYLLLVEQVWHIFMETGDDFADYLTLEKQDRVMGYQNSPLASERLKKI